MWEYEADQWIAKREAEEAQARILEIKQGKISRQPVEELGIDFYAAGNSRYFWVDAPLDKAGATAFVDRFRALPSETTEIIRLTALLHPNTQVTFEAEQVLKRAGISLVREGVRDVCALASGAESGGGRRPGGKPGRPLVQEPRAHFLSERRHTNGRQHRTITTGAISASVTLAAINDHRLSPSNTGRAGPAPQAKCNAFARRSDAPTGTLRTCFLMLL